MFATFLRLDSQNQQPQWRMVHLALSAFGIMAFSIIKLGASEQEFPRDSYIFTVAYLAVIGLIQLLWRPYSLSKDSMYIVAYHILVIYATLTITTYHPLFVAGWIVMMVAAGLLMHLKGAILSFCSFIGSILLLQIMRPLEIDVFLSLLVQALLIGSTALIVAQVIVMSQKRGSDLEQSRQKEHLERERLLALVNSMGDAVIATNEKGEIRIYNGAASSLLDTNVDLVGRLITRVLHLRDNRGHKIDLMKLLGELKGNTVRTDLMHQFLNKERINLYLNVAPIHLGYQSQGERGYTFLLRDITKEKSLEQERDEFISVVSHELRTPIAIAEGSLSNALVLQSRGISQDMINRSIKDAHEQVMFLSKMANDLATLSRAERGSKTLEIEPVDIASFLDDLHKMYETSAKEKGLKLYMKSRGRVGTISTSKLYLQEILQNFITNAIKYTKEGSVTVSAEHDRKGNAVFRVKDTGIGISKSDQKHLFEKFFRSEDYRTRESSGTGLGLYLVKKLAEQLNAKVTMESRLNYGSTFIVTVPPLNQPATDEPSAEAAE